MVGRDLAAPSLHPNLVLNAVLPQMVGDIRKYVQHISLSPDSIQNEEVSARPGEGLGMAGNVCVGWGPRLSPSLRTLPAGHGPTPEVPG